MSTLVVLSVVGALISVLFWILEIERGNKRMREVLDTKKGVAKVYATAKAATAYKEFAADILATTLFISYFGLNGVTGFTVGILVSDVFSTWIYVRSK